MLDASDFPEALRKESRTYATAILTLPPGLCEAVASSYLCLRAIDELEDSELLNKKTKVALLSRVSEVLQGTPSASEIDDALTLDQRGSLPEVTLRLADWAFLAPAEIAPRVWETVSAMAARMKDWVEKDFLIQDERDLDRYTFAVAGSVGLLLCDLWAWHDGTQCNRSDAVDFAQALQAVNIRRDTSADSVRGVSFIPRQWDNSQMDYYIQRKFQGAVRYLRSLPEGPALTFSLMPFELAQASAHRLAEFNRNTTRTEFDDVLSRLLAQS